jgi:deazaflavin-dependent oxidoreductase (nitroreductase family)
MPTAFGNFFIKTLVNSPLHFLLGESFAVITVTGRKTGRLISTPINAVTIGGTLTVISMRSRTWWRNLQTGGPAHLRRAGKYFAVRGEVVQTPADVAKSLTEYFAQYPAYAKYFNVHLDPDHRPDPEELERVAGERVLIRLFPV